MKASLAGEAGEKQARFLQGWKQLAEWMGSAG